MKNAEEITHCIQRIALNDSQVALKELYTYYFYDLLRYSMLYTSNPRDAEEVVSDTFFMVWNNRKQLLDIKNFNSYIYTVVRNKSISQFRALHIENHAGGNLAASNIRNLECPSYEVYLIDYGCGKFNKKVHIME